MTAAGGVTAARGVAHVAPFGDSAVLLSLGGAVGPETSRHVRSLAAAVEAGTAGQPGWGRPIPGASSVLVPVDPVAPGVTRAIRVLRSLVAGVAAVEASAVPGAMLPIGPIVEVSVRYGGDDGPDLLDVADRTGLTPAGVVELHAATIYEVLYLGFSPGFAYLGPLDARLVLPRLAVPRVRVPAGSVAIAGAQSAVYPSASPGGWRILGRTDMSLWDPQADPPARLAVGDRVRFVPIDHGHGRPR